MTNRILGTISILPAPPRRTAERVGLSAWILRARPRHSWRSLPRRTIRADRLVRPVQIDRSLRHARAIPSPPGGQVRVSFPAWPSLMRHATLPTQANPCDRERPLPEFRRAASQPRTIPSPYL